MATDVLNRCLNSVIHTHGLRRLTFVSVVLGITVGVSACGAASSGSPVTPDAGISGHGACGGQAVPAAQAISKVGSEAVIEGEVVLTNYASTSRGRPTFLDFHDPYQGYFTVVIWGANRDRLGGSPETTYDHKFVCVQGFVHEYRGAPEIVVSSTDQIHVAE